MGYELPVLVVEDSFLIAASLEETLLEAGRTVVVARSVAEAETAMADQSFAAALLDYMLPDGESLPLARRLHDGGCKVAVISGVDRAVLPEDDAIAAQFPKPMDEREVIAWVDQIMQVVTPAQASAGAGAGTVAPA